MENKHIIWIIIGLIALIFILPKLGLFASKPPIPTCPCIRPVNLCIQSANTLNSCGTGSCTGSWIVYQKTPRDVNCDNILDKSELGQSINNYLIGTEQRTNLAEDIQAWSK